MDKVIKKGIKMSRVALFTILTMDLTIYLMLPIEKKIVTIMQYELLLQNIS